MSAEAVRRWRTAHPGETLTAKALCEALGTTSLSEANLSGASLAGSNLAGSNLAGSNLRGSNLRGSNLAGSNLAGSNLFRANLAGSDLREADLREVSVSRPLLSCDTPSGWLTLVPLHDHWHLRIGCWTGTTDDLRTLIAGNDWPEAEGAEQDKRRPVLAAIADLVDAHIAYHGLNPLGSPDPEAVTR